MTPFPFLSGLTRARLLVALACLAAYANTLGAAELLRDDAWLILDNPLLRLGWGAVPELLTTGYVEAVEGGAATVHEYRPLLSLTYLFHVMTTGFAPGPMHAVNILLHVLACLLLLEALRRDLSLEAAAAGALLFAVMPVHTEVVSYITSRSELLTSCSVLGAWLCLDPDQGPPRIGAGCALYAAGMFSKEHAVLFPLFLAASDWTRRGRFLPSPERRPVYGALLACAALYLGLRGAVLAKAFHVGESYFAGVPPLSAALTVARFTIERYLWPSVTGLGLCVDYKRPSFPDSGPLDAGAWACLLAILAAGAVFLRAFLLRRGAWAFWILAPSGFLLPTSHLLLPIDTLGSERFLYLPTIGLAFLLGKAYEASGGGRARRWGLAALLSWNLALTVQRNQAWTSKDRYLKAALACNPSSSEMRSALGGHLLSLGRREEGLAELRRAADVVPPSSHPWFNLGRAAWETRDLKDAERFLRRALEINPRMSEAMVLLALVLEAGGRPAEARSWLERCVALVPRHALANYNLGRHLMAEGRRREAVGPFSVFLTYAPEDPDAPAIRELLRDLEAAAR